MPAPPPAPPLAKPLKRPSQARAQFTVQAIYDAFVRIWQRDGWARLTTRAVALETGISVGTLYDYFPNKQALLSGYVRHCVDALLARVRSDVVQAVSLPWQQRVRRLVQLTCGIEASGLPHFDHDMLLLESQIAEPKHHRRVYEELVDAWQAAFAACGDLPVQPGMVVIRSLVLATWGGRRYLLLLQPRDITALEWAAQMERLCIAALGGDQVALPR
jgi:AcrR family transcriptional regulator